MESEQVTETSPSYEKMYQIFSDFMTRITKFEELVDVGNRFLVGFQQGLDFLRRPPIDMTSELVANIIKANETRRLSSYIEAGCVNMHDRKQCLGTLSTCHHGLLDHLIGAKSVVNELQCLLDDAATAVQNSNENLQDKDFHGDLDSNTDIITKEDFLPAHVQKPEITDYAALMAVIYGMVKQDYEMQERIVSSLSLKSSSGEMESYCLMWSLRPFIDDEIIHKAWRLIR
ncbi:uncharacterized protein [Coffea arabica]|uniref:Uncharacterized protein LOC113710341 n=1 Tax=Coffea arabica TaxID=13443 RepID=A0A6P6UEW2_COFAR|nr:uncharacterized protein LOC113710341 [Coffea arabica]XP_027089094.1 uncharacterized protein LOC113710341 [Coffea arabica]XP_027089095.1 uncharacterized protein LOC113710341 [Coffea arabica]XP_027089096.1 uncharacterized protein LOC113710341 [Coffea arabica]